MADEVRKRPVYIRQPDGSYLRVEADQIQSANATGQAPMLGPQKPAGGAAPGLLPDSMFGGILPTLMSIMAMPASGGLSFPAAFGLTGMAGMTGKAMEAQFTGEEPTVGGLMSEFVQQGAPAGVGRLFNTAKKGQRYIRDVVAHNLPARDAEMMTRSATTEGLSGLTSKAFDKVKTQVDALINKLYNGAYVDPMKARKPGQLSNLTDEQWRRMVEAANERQITLPPEQASALKQRIAEAMQLLRHVEKLPTDKQSMIRGRIDPTGRVSATFNVLTDPSTRLGAGQILTSAGRPLQVGTELLTRGALGVGDMNQQNVRRRLRRNQPQP